MQNLNLGVDFKKPSVKSEVINEVMGLSWEISLLMSSLLHSRVIPFRIPKINLQMVTPSTQVFNVYYE